MSGKQHRRKTPRPRGTGPRGRGAPGRPRPVLSTCCSLDIPRRDAAGPGGRCGARASEELGAPGPQDLPSFSVDQGTRTPIGRPRHPARSAEGEAGLRGGGPGPGTERGPRGGKGPPREVCVPVTGSEGPGGDENPSPGLAGGAKETVPGPHPFLLRSHHAGSTELGRFPSLSVEMSRGCARPGPGPRAAAERIAAPDPRPCRRAAEGPFPADAPLRPTLFGVLQVVPDVRVSPRFGSRTASGSRVPRQKDFPQQPLGEAIVSPLTGCAGRASIPEPLAGPRNGAA